MKFSLLYKNYEETREFTADPMRESMEETIYDLSVDKAVLELCASGETGNYTLEVLKQPLKTVEEIEYRQAVLTDFVGNPRLLEELQELADKERRADISERHKYSAATCLRNMTDLYEAEVLEHKKEMW